MGKKLSQASTKISKTDKKRLNSLIRVLRPKVYITDSSNFKTLVQELTGNGNPISFTPPDPSNSIQEPVMEVPIIEIEDHGYQERSSLESSVDSSEASMPISFTTAAESPQELYVSETFNVLESSWNSHKVEYFPPYGDIESWLLQIDDSCSYNSDIAGGIPAVEQEVSFYDLSSLM